MAFGATIKKNTNLNPELQTMPILRIGRYIATYRELQLVNQRKGFVAPGLIPRTAVPL